MEAKMEIYKITNSENDKVYVGQTKVGIKKRFTDHKQAFKNYIKKEKTTTKLYNAFKKIGLEKFQITSLEKCNNQEEMDKKEKEWIEKFNSIKNGYNTVDGGNSTRMTNEIKKEIKRKAVERFSTDAGKKTREAVSAAQKKRIESGEHKYAGKSGKEHFNHKEIKQYDLEGSCKNVFFGSFEAQRETGINQSDIIKSCQNKNDRTPGGYLWFYGDEKEDEIKRRIEEAIKLKNKTQVTIKNLTTGEIKKFENAKKAAEEFGLSRSMITHMIREKIKINKKRNFEIL